MKMIFFDFLTKVSLSQSGTGGTPIVAAFHRWGQPVWESDDFGSGWDGKQNGKTVADGTYYWILEINIGTKNIKKTYKGSLTVIGAGKG